MSKLTHAQLSGDPLEFIDAPELDGVYALRQRDGETGAVIAFYALVYTSYMPTIATAKGWALNDRLHQFQGRKED